MGVSPTTVIQLQLLAGSKKGVAALELRETLVETPGEKVLELDELWSLVYRKSEKVWVWLALCRETCQEVVAFVMGDRSRATCELLYGKRFPRKL